MDNVLKQFQENSYLYGDNADFIETLYECYLETPDAVSSEWRKYFDQIQESNIQETSHEDAIKDFVSNRQVSASPQPSYTTDYNTPQKQQAVSNLIDAYRSRGHQQATLNPLEFHERPPVAALNPKFYGLSDSDMSKNFNTSFTKAPQELSLAKILLYLKQAYCGNFSVEYTHIASSLQKLWIQERFETFPTRPEFTPEKKHKLLERIIAAEGIEKYLHTKYVGQKRFSLEGGESLIIILDDIIQNAAEIKVEEIVIGMAHRGRLNVLVNILGKSPRELYQEFEGSQKNLDDRPGDVKYHQGFSSNVETSYGNMHLALSFNPSHLEIIDPVVIGSVRARQRRRNDHSGQQVVPILIHGDSAFAAQGVVMETLNMSQAQGYTVGGTVHIIVNNQIGFTTSNPLDMRSTVYCSDVAKMVQAPIFHVNGDDPEAVAFITRLALEFRMAFNKDVVINMICYRRHGHNEADEPAATQPMMYQKINAHPTTATLYADQLVSENIITQDNVQKISDHYQDALDQGDVVALNILPHPDNKMVNWGPYKKEIEWDYKVDTTLDLDQIKQLANSLNKIPDGFELHPRVEKILSNRNKMAVGAQLIDWGFAETMAYASLLIEGYPIRLSGQDSGRGTFFHRHAVLHNQKDGESYTPLQHLNEDQAQFIVIDSLLSEEAVLGFEYGYSTTDPNSLTIWEAQFGDFANGAQVVIDQFITSGEAKWRRLCGLVLFLPHGYEGQGPEHSSARVERYLQLCADHNIQVCNPTTPAQIFHMLRRQMIRPYRKPLIVFTPKSLLRHKLATSTLDDLSQGVFQTLIPEHEEQIKKQVRRIIFCSGKIYYELLEARKIRKIDDIALIRIEQLYPFPHNELIKLIKQYPNTKEIVWCQEEPKNQGAWYQTQHNIKEFIRADQTLFYAGPAASASPAAGRFKLHLEIQKKLINDALSDHSFLHPKIKTATGN